MFCPNCGNQIPDGAAFCTFCGTKQASPVSPVAPVTEAVAPVVEQVAAPVVEQVAPVVEQVENVVEQVAAPVVEQVAPVVEQVAAPVVEQVAPVVEQAAPVVEPVYQQPVQQPMYQQPVQPAQQPMYQQPVYPQYQQPMYQQPVAQPKKKSKAPLIITIILLVLLLAAGGLVVYETFFASEEDRLEWLSALDFKKTGASIPMSENEQKIFKKIVKTMDEAIAENEAADYVDCVPSYARDFVWSVYGLDNAKDFVKYLHSDEDNGVSKVGDDIKVSEEIVSAKKIKDVEELSDSFKSVFKKSVDISAAYLVKNNSTFKGSDDKETYVDYYLFVEVDDEWSVILVGEDNLEKFDLKK